VGSGEGEGDGGEVSSCPECSRREAIGHKTETPQATEHRAADGQGKASGRSYGLLANDAVSMGRGESFGEEGVT
jgi:hypothetical protein